MRYLALWSVVLGLLLCAGCGERGGETNGGAASEATPNGEAPPEAAGRIAVDKSFGKLPLMFIENKGQHDVAVLFYINGPRGTVFFTKDAVVFSVRDAAPKRDDERLGLPRPGEEDTGDAEPTEPPRVKVVVIRRNFEGANDSPKVEGTKELVSKVNIFRGNDQSKWLTGIRTFEQIEYKEIWPNIDMIYRGSGGNLKCEFLVRPGGDPSKVVLRYEGLDKLSLSDDGELILHTALGNIKESSPHSFQGSEDTKEPVEAAFKLLDETRCSLGIGEYDGTRPLVIDPLFTFD
jgi:hypothetical protein